MFYARNRMAGLLNEAGLYGVFAERAKLAMLAARSSQASTINRRQALLAAARAEASEHQEVSHAGQIELYA